MPFFYNLPIEFLVFVRHKYMPQAVCFVISATLTSVSTYKAPTRRSLALVPAAGNPWLSNTTDPIPTDWIPDSARRKTHPHPITRRGPRPILKSQIKNQNEYPEQSTETSQQTMLATGLRFIFVATPLRPVPLRPFTPPNPTTLSYQSIPLALAHYYYLLNI